jgi:hypothetical protein
MGSFRPFCLHKMPKTTPKKKIIKSLAGKDKATQKFVEDAVDNFGGKEEVKPVFSISLTIADKVYKSVGATALEALSSLPKPEKITNKGILTITDGVKSNQVLMQIPNMKRLFFLSKSLLEVYMKTLIQGLK